MKFLSKIRDEIFKPFKAPIICGILLLTGMFFLMKAEDESGRMEREQRDRAFARGFHESCELMVSHLTADVLEKEKLSKVFDLLVVSARPLTCVMLLDSKGVVLSSKDSPEGFAPKEAEGEQLLDGLFLLWSPLKRKEQDSSLRLVTGLDFGHSEDGMRRHVSRLFWKYSIIGCVIVIAMLLWASTIYTRELSARLEQEKSEKEYLNQLGLSAAGLAHETKNPLGIILGLAQRLSTSDDASPQIQNVACQIMDNAENAASRLGEFIEYARLRDADIGVVDGKALIDRAVATLVADFEDSAVSLASKTGPLSIMCDEDMTLQVLLNLLLNSLRATEEGDSVTVSLSSDGGFGVIKIEDNGKGISPALLPDVFKPYVSSSEDGHGLGLAIVKRVSQCHNWKVDISSKEGNGTTVSIRNIQIAGKIQPDRLREV